MKSARFLILLPATCLCLFATPGVAQSTTVSRARSAPGPDPDLFDGAAGEAESRPESGIISDFEQGSGESAQQNASNPSQQQQKQGSGQQQGGGQGGGQGSEGGEQGEGQGGGGSEEMIEEGEMPEQQGQQGGQQGEQGGQQGQQGQQGGQQGQSSSSSSSSQQGSAEAPQNNVQLGDDSLKIDTVEMPADESLIGQEESKGKEAKDTGAGGASGQQGPRRNTGVETGDAMPSDI